MAKLSRRRVACEVVRLIVAEPARKSELLRQVAAYLIQTKQSGTAHLFLDDMADELLATQGTLSADVRTAFGLNDTTRDSIIAMLKRETGAQTVELSVRVEPELIGGVVITTPQFALDASIKRQLTQLAGGMN
jgi:F-type H+-transporting ATPase subunit delta